MRNVLIGIACAVALVLGRFALHEYYVHQAEDAEMDAFVAARLSQPPAVPLDCAPFGQLKVNFDPEDSTPELTAENMPWVVKNWNGVWPAAYAAISQKAKEYNSQDHLAEKLTVTVILPKGSFAVKPDWNIELRSAGGIFTANLSGMVVKDTSADF